MKVFLIILVIFINFNVIANNNGDVFRELGEEAEKMLSIIKDQCNIEFDQSSGSLRFCTGVTLTQRDFKFLKELNLDSCQQFLKQSGQNVIWTNEDGKYPLLTNKDLVDFYSSTKLALFDHEKKLVLFKSGAKRGDCLHEVLHFYQHQRPSKSALHPANRFIRRRKYQFLLERAVSVVENIEKSGNVKEAKEIADGMAPFIQVQNRWFAFGNWIDEVEIYQLIYFYPNLINTTERDRDIALANLIKYQERLNWKKKEIVLREATLALNKKYQDIKPKKDNKSEKELDIEFRQGKISRDEFERRVIGLRKYYALEKAKKAQKDGNLYGELMALGEGRFFNPSVDLVSINPKITFQYMTQKDLPIIEFNNFKTAEVKQLKLVLDLGAQISVLPPKVLIGLKSEEVSLIGMRKLHSFRGLSFNAPVIAIHKEIKIGNNKFKNFVAAIYDLRLPGQDGVLGMNFFNQLGKKFPQMNLSFQENKVYFSEKFPEKNVQTFPLRKNETGYLDTIELICNDNQTVIRIDTGSQVIGDVRNGNLEKVQSCLLTKAQFFMKNRDDLYFSRDVVANIGFPFLKKYYAKILIDLEKKRIMFVKK